MKIAIHKNDTLYTQYWIEYCEKNNIDIIFYTTLNKKDQKYIDDLPFQLFVIVLGVDGNPRLLHINLWKIIRINIEIVYHRDDYQVGVGRFVGEKTCFDGNAERREEGLNICQ